MSAPHDFSAFDLDQALAAAEAWVANTRSRETKLKDIAAGHFKKVEGAVQLANRTKRLIGHMRRKAEAGGQKGVSDAVAELLAEEREIAPETVDDALFERVLGATRDFLSIRFCAVASRMARSVGRIVTRLPDGRVGHGSGFLVAPGVLLTNWHVLETDDHAARSTVEFDFQTDEEDQPLLVQRFPLQPRVLFYSHKEFDYAFVAVGNSSQRGQAQSDPSETEVPRA